MVDRRADVSQDIGETHAFGDHPECLHLRGVEPLRSPSLPDAAASSSRNPRCTHDSSLREARRPISQGSPSLRHTLTIQHMPNSRQTSITITGIDSIA